MPSPDQERLDAISSALGNIVRRQNDFDRRLSGIEAALPFEPETPPAAEDAPPTPAPPPPPPEPAHASSGALETRVGLTIANRAGVVTLVLGIGFLFKLTIDNQWIGPAGRVLLGIFASFAALAVADVLWRRGQRIFAQGVTATGSAILHLSIYAAFGFYQLIPQSVAFVFMAGNTALAGALALRYGALAVAALSLAGGFLTPVLLSTGEDRPWFLFGYVLLLDLGALSLARRRNWRLLEALSLAGTLILYQAWLVRFRPEVEGVATVYLLVFYALFAAAATTQPLFLILQLFVSIAASEIWPRHPGPYFTISLIFILAALASADRRSWRLVPTFALTSFGAAYLIWISRLSDPIPTGTIFLGLTGVFLAFFAWMPWWTMVRRREARAPDLIVLAYCGAAYFGASYMLLNSQFHAWMGLFAVVLAGAHLAMAAQLWRISAARDQSATPVLLAGGIALSFLTLAAPIQFSAYRITLSWAFEAAAVTWIGARSRKVELAFAGLVISVLVLIRLFTLDASIYPAAAGHAALWNQRFVTFALSALCFWLSAYWNRPARYALFHYLAGHVVLLWTLTQEILDWAARRTALKDLPGVETVSISILYALYAVVLIGIGVGARSALNRIAGLALIGMVVAKLYLFDVWQLSRLHLTLAFVALGMLLLSTSYLYSRFRGLVENWLRDDQAPS